MVADRSEINECRVARLARDLPTQVVYLVVHSHDLARLLANLFVGLRELLAQFRNFQTWRGGRLTGRGRSPRLRGGRCEGVV
jgi:hypothetical protein